MASVYSVSQVNSYIKNMFAQDFALSRITVRGEVSNCKYHTSGHIYFTLKDGTGTLAAVMFAGQRKGLSFQLQEGQQVVVTGSVDVYERDGKYQLYARKIEQEGRGDLYQRFLEAAGRTGRDGHVRAGVQAAHSSVRKDRGRCDGSHWSGYPGYHEYHEPEKSVCPAGPVSGSGAGSRSRCFHCQPESVPWTAWAWMC